MIKTPLLKQSHHDAPMPLMFGEAMAANRLFEVVFGRRCVDDIRSEHLAFRKNSQTKYRLLNLLLNEDRCLRQHIAF
jgi:hypothetical protein